MEIGVLVESRTPGAAQFARDLEAMGVASVWAPEIWGYDALTGLAYLAGQTTSLKLGTFIVQLGSRSPALLAGSALSIQQPSGGRFILGVGVSGPKAMRAWHGVEFTKPLAMTRETIEIVGIDPAAHRVAGPFNAADSWRGGLLYRSGSARIVTTGAAPGR